MCRFALYIGERVPIASLVTDPEYSILHQSYHSHEREEPLNGDGFGVAWYVDDDSPPALFKEVHPAWNSMNLRNLASVTHSRCLLAHVRAATPGLPVTQLNCHPFCWDRLTFMHNGIVGGFPRLKQRLVSSVSEESYLEIEGTTDSEHVFALVKEAWLEVGDAADPLDRLETALRAGIERVERLKSSAGVEAQSLLNIVLCDGERAVVSRYASPGHASANSLYIRTGREFACIDRIRTMAGGGAGHDALIAASEPLTSDEGWERVPANHFVRLARGAGFEIVPA